MTLLATMTNHKRGYVKGQPQKYIKGHPTTRKERLPCAADSCVTLTTAEYCVKHATRMRRYGDLEGKRHGGTAEERYWWYVLRTETCWVWGGSTADTGYGVHWTDEHRLIGAHRYSFELHGGLIPEGLQVCHRCDNPPCVNPDHLFLGDALGNAQDMVHKGRARNAHTLSPVHVKCRECGQRVNLTASQVLHPHPGNERMGSRRIICNGSGASATIAMGEVGPT